MRRGLFVPVSFVLFACGPSPAGTLQQPTHVTVLPFRGPPGGAAAGGFVVAYDPWSGGVSGVTVKDGSRSELVTDAAVWCANISCSYNRESRYLTLDAASIKPGVGHVEIVVEKDGFEPLHVSVPLLMHDRHPSILVVLTPKGSLPAGGTKP